MGGFVFLAIMSYLVYWIIRHRRKSNGLGIESSRGKTWKAPWRLPHFRIEIRGDPKSPSELDPQGEKHEIDSRADPARQISELEGSSVQQDHTQKATLGNNQAPKVDVHPRSSESTLVSDSTQTYEDSMRTKPTGIGSAANSRKVLDSSQEDSYNQDFECSTYVDSGTSLDSSFGSRSSDAEIGHDDSDSSDASDSDELSKGIHSGKC